MNCKARNYPYIPYQILGTVTQCNTLFINKKDPETDVKTTFACNK